MTPAQLRALRLQAAALLATVDAALQDSGQAIPSWECPSCKSTLPPADGRDVLVCQACNYNDPKEPTNG
jgi:hypothetical protein